MTTAIKTLSEALEGRGCLGKAARMGAGEMPVFVLIASDHSAPERVREWAAAVELFYGRPTDKTRGARMIALEMEQWQRDNPEHVKVPD
jgi:hypothetical protein